MAGREAAHVDALVVDCVHADTIAEERAARLALARIDAEDRDRLLGLVAQEAADELVHQARLAGAARAGDAEHGGGGAAGQLAEGRADRVGGAGLVFCGRD